MATFEITRKMLIILGNQRSSVLAGFTYGFITSFNRQFFKQPLSQMFGGAIMGSILMLGADFIASMVPKEIKSIIPLLLSIATVYHVTKTITESDD